MNHVIIHRITDDFLKKIDFQSLMLFYWIGYTRDREERRVVDGLRGNIGERWHWNHMKWWKEKRRKIARPRTESDIKMNYRWHTKINLFTLYRARRRRRSNHSKYWQKTTAGESKSQNRACTMYLKATFNVYWNIWLAMIAPHLMGWRDHDDDFVSCLLGTYHTAFVEHDLERMSHQQNGLESTLDSFFAIDEEYKMWRIFSKTCSSGAWVRG